MLNIIQKMTQKRAPRLLTVERATFVTPNMVRITFSGESLVGIPSSSAGGNCKIMIPETGQSRDEFLKLLNEGPRPTTRTYTVREVRTDPMEMDIDFVAHGLEGPASAWAINADRGDFCGFAGPSAPKVTEFYADWYLIAADMSAIPVAAATLEAMPRDAKGIAIFEIISEKDKQSIATPPGIECHWLISPDPHKPSSKQMSFVESIEWPDGIIQTCIAGESNVIKSLRHYVNIVRQVDRKHTYISGYWKIGLIEDEHQAMKRADAKT